MRLISNVRLITKVYGIPFNLGTVLFLHAHGCPELSLYCNSKHFPIGPYSVNISFSYPARMLIVVLLSLAIMAIINDIHRDFPIAHAQLNRNASCSCCVSC